MLCEPLMAEHIKPRLLGHFGTVPGLNLVWAHANRQIVRRDLDAAFVAGPGHGGTGPNACAWLEGTYSELYSHISQDASGMAAFFRQFSFPEGVPSHCAPETPGSFHEGGELGYSLRCCTRSARHSTVRTNRLLCHWRRGGLRRAAGHQLARPHLLESGRRRRRPADTGIESVQNRQPDDPGPHPRIPTVELLRGYGYEPHVVAGSDSAEVHQAMTAALDACLDRIADIHYAVRADSATTRPMRPMIVLRTPKGWTCPPVVDGQQVEGIPSPSSAAARGANRRATPAGSRAVTAVLPARGTVRRHRPPSP